MTRVAIGRVFRSVLAVTLFLTLLEHAVAQSSDSVLSDVNGDGIVQGQALGDSITYGVGDGIAPTTEVEQIEDAGPAKGYPFRLSQLIGVTFRNDGVPGEELTDGGQARVPDEVANSAADVVTLFWGANDAVIQTPSSDFRRALQRSINVIKALGKNVLLVTPPPPCCGHSTLRPFTSLYANIVRELAGVNDVSLFDLEAVWLRRCPANDKCPLINRPEGLHPNTLGYDFISLGLSAALLGIPIETPSDGERLASALGLEPEAVVSVLFGQSN